MEEHAVPEEGVAREFRMCRFRTGRWPSAPWREEACQSAESSPATFFEVLSTVRCRSGIPFEVVAVVVGNF